MPESNFVSYIRNFKLDNVLGPIAVNDSISYHILKQIQDNPGITQRELAKEAGLSLGKTNYCLRALIDKGLIKVANFHHSPKKRAYLYKLTPKGIEEKARVTYRFLRRKQREYEALKTEIEHLRQEVEASADSDGPNPNAQSPSV